MGTKIKTIEKIIADINFVGKSLISINDVAD